ncbi:MAG: hypothetical protein AAB834_03595 [Patescibacteria group bacterium]
MDCQGGTRAFFSGSLPANISFRHPALEAGDEGRPKRNAGDMFMGVRMARVFALAKEFADMTSHEIALRN